MPKSNKPQSANEVFQVMQKYCQDKGYNFSNQQLIFMGESCYLYFESRGWKGIKYWPAVAMRWVLTNLERSYETRKSDKQTKSNYKPKPPKGKSVRDKVMEQENND